MHNSSLGTKLTIISIALVLWSCGNDTAIISKVPNTEMMGPARNQMSFQERQIIEGAKWWWALAVGDVTGDGLQDVIAINNNANGGYLAYYAAQESEGIWQETIIAETPPAGGTFASGDLEVGDIDKDGDLDVLAVKHTGEWDDAGAPAELFWYENRQEESWIAHLIGDAPDAVKDLSLADFDGDGRLDLAVLTFDEGNLSIHRQTENGTFDRVLNRTYPNLHEGMDVGDFDGDGDLDIVAGVNPARAVNLGKQDTEVFVFVNEGDNKNWTRMIIQTGGVYNGRVIDFEGDGDYDLFRYPDHEAKELYLLLNQTR